MSDAPVRVLVCDDDAMTRRLVERLLRDMGLTCIRSIADPALLTSEVHDFDPQLVLLDRHMGGLDGMDALQVLVAAPGREHRAVCLVTGDDRPEVRVEAMAHGADGVLFKPFEQADFRTQIEQLLQLDDRGAGDALPVSQPPPRIVTELAQRPVPERAATDLELLARLEELEAANAALREANAAKSEFLSRASHELRTPLTSVLGFAALLSKAPLGEEPQTWANLILKAGRHLLDLLNDLLDVSRIESGELYLSLEPVSISAVSTDVYDLMRPVAEAHGIEVTIELAEGRGAYALADHQRLRQVVINLLSNAIKYNRPGGEVQLVVTSPTDDAVRIDVCDTGPGMSAEQLSRLFVAFERLDAAQTAVEGTGLGLALSNRLTESMQGTLTVASTVGVGSVFTVILGRVRPAVLDDDAAPDDPPTTRRYSRSRNVLYVEDLATNIQLVTDLVQHRPDITLIPATRGELALELAHRHRPDLILLDLHLPDMGGEEVLAVLRADPLTRKIPVVVLSADATAAQQTRLLAAGADAYLTKPLRAGRVLEVIDQHLDQHAGTNAVPWPPPHQGPTETLRHIPRTGRAELPAARASHRAEVPLPSPPVPSAGIAH